MKRPVTVISTLLFLALACSPKSETILPEDPPLAQKLQSASTGACPAGMLEIDGDFCPVVQQQCLYMVDNNGKRTNAIPTIDDRCGEFANPVKCLAPKVHKHYCIDRFEFPNQEGEIPIDWLSWYGVKAACKAENKRMCTRSEWTLAAEGPSMHPYPYGNGFHRDKTICNFDNHLSEQPATIKHIHRDSKGREYVTMDSPTGDDVMKVTNANSDVGQSLHKMLVPSGSKDQCVSDYGVHDMPGNIDEWVINETGKPYVSGLMGGHVFGVRNASRPMTEAHNPEFYWYETGGRCCADLK